MQFMVINMMAVYDKIFGTELKLSNELKANRANVSISSLSQFNNFYRIYSPAPFLSIEIRFLRKKSVRNTKHLKFHKFSNIPEFAEVTKRQFNLKVLSQDSLRE